VVLGWIGLAQDRIKWRALVNVVMGLRVPLNVGKLLSVYTTGGLTSTAQLQSVVCTILYGIWLNGKFVKVIYLPQAPSLE
jgi:hypothetical protein